MLADPRARLSPMGTIMLMDEFREGRVPLWPHDAPAWVRHQDWRQWPVLATANGELHIVAVHSARSGALTDLIADAKAAGLSPVIVKPIGPTMPAILAKWGWQRTVMATARGDREEWRPTPMVTNDRRTKG